MSWRLTAAQAVKDAYAAVATAEGRQALDAAREDAELRSMMTKMAAQAERERQWRVAQGLEAPGRPLTAGPQGRDAWMTDLPAARRAVDPAAMSQARRSLRPVIDCAAGFSSSCWCVGLRLGGAVPPVSATSAVVAAGRGSLLQPPCPSQTTCTNQE